MSHNRNPKGKNGHQASNLSPTSERKIATSLIQYHREGMSSNVDIRQRLVHDVGINIGITNIKGRRNALGLFGARSKRSGQTSQQIEQAILTQLDKDPAMGKGVAGMKTSIAHDQGLHIKRDVVSEVMHTHAPGGFVNRHPGTKRIFRVSKSPVGINERWACDGHDKLYGIGFPLYGFVDDASAIWLFGRIVPSNREGSIVAYLFLCVIEKFKGMPLQFSTDCGSETTHAYGLVSALREIFHPDFDLTELPAHVYMRSIHNISVERSWLKLRIDFGDNAKIYYEDFPDCFDPQDPNHVQLSRWLWAKTLQLELDRFMSTRNSQKTRKNEKKAGPSGASRNNVYAMPEKYGLTDKLLPLTEAQLKIVAEIKEALGGEDLVAFVPREFSDQAEAVFDTLNVLDLRMEIAWEVFGCMLPLFDF